MSHPVNDSAVLGLLSLSMAAAQAVPVASAAPDSTTALGAAAPTSAGIMGGVAASVPSGGLPLHTGIKHRRLSSTGQTKRRLSDARDAANRPSITVMQTAASAFSSMSLASPPPSATSETLASLLSTTLGTQPMAIPTSDHKPASAAIGASKSVPLFDGTLPSEPVGNGTSVSGAKGMKKKGMIFTCESCSKVYRHPSCLIKHRWEHSPHWREASKFVLSKHQQVQLLEAAAILSHLSTSPTGTTLPEDRSLWPSFLSGGLLPPPSTTTVTATSTTSTATSDVASYPIHPTSSSVPATSILISTSRASSAGPKMHDYAIPASASSAGGLTQLRPGLLGVPIGSGSGNSSAEGTPAVLSPGGSYQGGPTALAAAALAMPASKTQPVDVAAYRRGDPQSLGTDAWAAPASASSGYSASFRSTSSARHSHAHSFSLSSFTQSDGTGGWSLPRSDVRSVSGSHSGSRSRSRSGSGSAGSEFVDVEGEPDGDVGDMEMSFDYGGGRASAERVFGPAAWKRGREPTTVKEEDEDDFEVLRQEAEGEWAGMDMDMD